MKYVVYFSLAAFASLSLVAALTHSKKTQDANGDFRQFVSHFEQADFPYEITMRVYGKDEPDLEKEQLIPYEFSNFLPNQRPMYSRLPPDRYRFEKLVASNERFVALVVSKSRAFVGSPMSYELISYTPTGKVLESKELAKFNNSEVTNASINKDLEITLTTYSFDNEENAIGSELATNNLHITPSGKIGDNDAPSKKAKKRQIQTPAQIDTRASLF
jgi:hypothetical protein